MRWGADAIPGSARSCLPSALSRGLGRRSGKLQAARRTSASRVSSFGYLKCWHPGPRFIYNWDFPKG